LKKVFVFGFRNTDMLWIPKINTLTNKEPWLAANLSWLLPGMGHLYSGAYSCGASLIVIAGIIYIFWLGSLISARTPIIITLLINLCSSLVLPVYASWSALRLTKRHNTEDFERERTISKDPWLAIFLSVVLPGLGHIYLHKWIVGILSFLGLFVIVIILRLMEIDTFLAIIIYRTFVSVHAYIACQVYKVKPKRPLILFIIVYICICFLNGILLPQLEKRLVHIFGSISGTSMNPTLVKGDRVVVNSITYSFNNPLPGDVIMFHPPKNVSDKKVPACKRIIAIGGETVEVRNGNVYVDGQERNFGVQTGPYAYPDSSLPLDFYGKRDNPYLAYGVHEPYHVPDDHYFILGDNRMYSADSRYFGAIPRKNIIGKVIKIYWPPRRIGLVR